MDDHPSDLSLDRLILEGTDAQSAPLASAHIASCPRCQQRLQAFQQARRAAMSDPRYAAVQAALSSAESRERPAVTKAPALGTRWRLWFGAGGVAAAAAMIAAVALVHGSTATRFKGSATLEVIAEDPPHPPPFHRGEQVALELTTVGAEYALVFAVDGHGSVSPVWPTRQKESGAISARPVMRLQPSFRVTPGSVRLFALLTEQPVPLEVGTQMLSEHLRSLPTPPSLHGVWVEAPMAVEGGSLRAVAVGLVLFLASQAMAGPRRYALLVGSNRGVGDDQDLQFAESDAERMRQTLLEVGDVQPEDAITLLDPSSTELQQALDRLDARIKANRSPQDQVLIYVSGHADSGELHLSGTRLPLHTLIDYLKRSTAAVAILIVDSCRSGSATRIKGLEPVESTQINVELPEIRGRIVIGSSGSDELSQESDALQGSIFTHHLIAGLRGAADTSHDGVVTLQEAYTYAYALTVESTFATRGGVQHPSYSVDLHGQGDLVLSQPLHARGRLRLDVQAPGEWLVYAVSGRDVVAQFEKVKGPAMIALLPGEYRLIDRQGDQYQEALADIPEGGEAVVAEGNLHPTEFAGLTKGSAESTLEVGVDALVGTGVTTPVGASAGFAVWSTWQRRWLGPVNLLAVELTGQTASTSSSVGAPYSEETLDLRLGPGVAARWAALELQLSGQVGWVLVRQSQPQAAGNSGWFGVEPELGLAPRAQVAIGGPAFIGIGGFGGVEWIRTETNVEARLRADAKVGVGFAF